MGISEDAINATMQSRASTEIRHIHAICLDLDDTLWAIAPVIERAEHRLYEWLAAHYPRIAGSCSIDDMRATRAAIIEEYPELSFDFSFLRKAVIAKHARDVGYPADELVEEAFSVFFDARNEVDVYEDVRPVLERLKPRYTLIALTNGNADLVRIGLDDLFDHGINAVDVGAGKPDPAIFEAAMRCTRLEASQILHVGDDPEGDVIGARDVGMFSVWINRCEREWPIPQSAPDAVIRDLHGLLEVLESPHSGAGSRSGDRSYERTGR